MTGTKTLRIFNKGGDDEKNFCSCTNAQAFETYKNELAKRTESYKENFGRTKLHSKTITHLSAIVNFNKEHSPKDIKKICDYLESLDSKSIRVVVQDQEKLEYIKVYSDIENIENSLKDRKTLNIYDLKGHLGQKEATILAKSNLVIVITTNEDLVLKKTYKFFLTKSKTL